MDLVKSHLVSAVLSAVGDLDVQVQRLSSENSTLLNQVTPQLLTSCSASCQTKLKTAFLVLGRHSTLYQLQSSRAPMVLNNRARSLQLKKE